MLDNSRTQGDNLAKIGEDGDFRRNSDPISNGVGIFLRRGKPEFTTWLPFGLSSRVFDPKTPTLRARRIANGDNPPPPIVGYRRYFDHFLIEFSTTVGR